MADALVLLYWAFRTLALAASGRLLVARARAREASYRIGTARRRSVHTVLFPVVSVQLAVALTLGATLIVVGPHEDDRLNADTAAFAKEVQDGGPFRGLATWVDMYDWTRTYTGGQPRLGPESVDAMARLGVQVLEIQAGSARAPSDVLEPALLQQWIDRAHANGIRVVAWYLPTLVDVGGDAHRLAELAKLPVEGLGIDIESEDVGDPGVRSQRLVQLSQFLRANVHLPLQAIVMPPVVLDAINPAFWPGFPWGALAPLYDVWTPMSYWTDRLTRSGYRDAYRYAHDNVEWLRRDLGRPLALVTIAGGEGDRSSLADVSGMLRAAADTAAAGGGMYDFRTTAPAAWSILAPLRR